MLVADRRLDSARVEHPFLARKHAEEFRQSVVGEMRRGLEHCIQNLHGRFVESVTFEACADQRIIMWPDGAEMIAKGL